VPSLNSISTRLILIATLVVTLVLVIYGVLSFSHQRQQIINLADRSVSLAGKRLQNGLPNALWNFDDKQVEILGQSEIDTPFVASVTILDQDGKQKFSQANNNQTIKNKIELPLIYLDNNEEKTVGKIQLSISLTAINEQLDSVFWSIVLQVISVNIVLVIALTVLSRILVTTPLDKIAKSMTDIAQGERNLMQRLEVEQTNELRQLSSQFNIFVEQIETVIISISDCTSALYRTSGEVKTKADSGNHALEIQQQHINQVAVSVATMYGESQTISERAHSTSDAANEAMQKADQVQQVVTDTISSFDEMAHQLSAASQVIESLETSVGGIVSIVGVIGSIAEQTNLLALNAAIEAARAGEQGRGFAVVADEVRALASRTQQSTREINNMIQGLQSGAKSAVTVIQASTRMSESAISGAHQSGEAINSITESIHHITEMSKRIVEAIEQQGVVSAELQKSIAQIIRDGYSSAESITGMSIDSMELTQLADVLRTLVQQFKVSKGSALDDVNTPKHAEGSVELW
jgi:methyl-accepting chemotaxis protein